MWYDSQEIKSETKSFPSSEKQNEQQKSTVLFIRLICPSIICNQHLWQALYMVILLEPLDDSYSLVY